NGPDPTSTRWMRRPPPDPWRACSSATHSWIVLEGRLGFQLDEERREVPAGESLLVRRGTQHSYWNPAAEPARYLLVMTPRIHRLIEELHAGGRADYAQIFREHDSELLS